MNPGFDKHPATSTRSRLRYTPCMATLLDSSSVWKEFEMAELEHRFVATGPTERSTGSEPDFTAFGTGWIDPQNDYGANVQGRVCGLYADTLHGAVDENNHRQIPDHTQAGVAVFALGDTTGVHGETRGDGIGVHGRSTHGLDRVEGTGRGVGVQGEGAGRGWWVSPIRREIAKGTFPSASLERFLRTSRRA
jgi:hypothetical protein